MRLLQGIPRVPFFRLPWDLGLVPIATSLRFLGIGHSCVGPSGRAPPWCVGRPGWPLLLPSRFLALVPRVSILMAGPHAFLEIPRY